MFWLRRNEMCSQVLTLVPHSSTFLRVKLNSEVKTRVTKKTLQGLEVIAQERELSVSDIVREALRTYLGKDNNAKDMSNVRGTIQPGRPVGRSQCVPVLSD